MSSHGNEDVGNEDVEKCDMSSLVVVDAATRWYRLAQRRKQREISMSPKNRYTGLKSTTPLIEEHELNCPGTFDTDLNPNHEVNINHFSNLSVSSPRLETVESMCREHLNAKLVERRASGVESFDDLDGFIGCSVARIDRLDRLLKQQDEDISAVENEIEQSSIDFRPKRASFQQLRRQMIRIEEKIIVLKPSLAEAKANEDIMQFFITEKLSTRDIQISELNNDINEINIKIRKLEKARDDTFIN
eukprot:CAMPEP_0194238954 /NCGR_PEP_ID=MMETSP0158-20130606/5564_1 /TAXON_ID=33649 /ORGANISM="Thalassionema nitzschioides, Strain L26-B" /LENGTH=245 /DNA_ID=CAMNT_0038973321 /DNA_START=130 /DNA_END=868 /DNA_ORIENTATION=-